MAENVLEAVQNSEQDAHTQDVRASSSDVDATPSNLSRIGTFDSRRACQINRMPPEILAMMFLSSFPTLREDRPTSYTLIRHGSTRELYPPLIPMLISRVCKLWRSVAFSTPALWATIALDGDELIMSLDLISEWISRTKAYPLSLQCYLPDLLECGSFNEGASRRVRTLKIILHYITRWSYLYIRAPYHRYSLDWLYEQTQIHDITPNFESLRILKLYVIEEDFTVIRSTFLERSPNLRQFELRKLAVAGDEDDSKIVNASRFMHWVLTKLDLDNVDLPVQVVIGIVRDCPSLMSVEMTIDIYDAEDAQDWEDHDTILVHRSLEYLGLAMPLRGGGPELEYLCTRICLPHLTGFDIDCSPSCLDAEYFRQFLTRSSCHLRSFLFFATDTEDLTPSLIRLLLHPSMADSLEELDFWNDGDDDDDFHPQLTDELLDCLTLTPTNIVLPRLRDLTISAEFGVADGFSKLARMLESRFTPPVLVANGHHEDDPPDIDVALLKKAYVHLRVLPSYWAEDDSQLYALQEKGFNLSLDLECRTEGNNRERKILKPLSLLATQASN